MDIAFLIRGIVVGFSIAAPVGPIGILCIRRTLARGRVFGFVSGLGAATADAAYGLVAAAGLTSISAFLVGHLLWLRLLGGMFLCYLGARSFAAPVSQQAAPARDGSHLGAYASTLLLTLTNPMTILSFAAIFAAVGLGTMRSDYHSAGLIVLGVFLGSALWWGVLSSITGGFRAGLRPGGLRWVNRLSGAIIATFGVVAVLSIFR